MSETPHTPVVAEYRPVRMAYWLWATGFLLTVPSLLVNLLGAGLELDPGRLVFTIGTLVLAVVVVEHFRRGRPLARAALAGFTGYCVAGSVVELTGVSVVGTLDSLSMTFVIIGLFRAGVLVAALVLSYSTPVNEYVTAGEPDGGVPAVRGAVGWWAVSVAALAGQLIAALVDILPSGGETWRDWLAVDASSALGVAMGLALLPSWCCTVRQFRLGRQWARGTLTALGVAIGAIEVDMLASSPAMTPMAVLATLHLAATVVALVLSYRRRGLLDREPVPASIAARA